MHTVRIVLLVFVLCWFSNGKAQTNIDLERIVLEYLQKEEKADQYDALAGLMEFNANLSLQEAKLYFEEFSSEEYEKKDPRYPLIGHFLAADVLYYHNLKDSSIFHYLSLANLAKARKENMLAASGVGNAAFVLAELGDKIGALNLLKQNLEIAENSGDIRDLADQTFSIANYYADLNLQDSAIYYFEKTIDIDRKASNKSGMVYNMQILLDQYLRENKVKQALDICEECISVSKEIKDAKAEAFCHYFKSRALLKLKKPDEALKSVESAMNIDKMRNDRTRLSQYYRLLGEIHSQNESFQSAEEYYKKAIDIAESNRVPEEVVETLLPYARSYFEQEKYSKSTELLSKAEKVSQRNGLDKYLLTIYRQFGETYSEMNDLEQALEYEVKESNLLANRLTSQNLMATDQSKNAYDLFKMDNINRALSAEKELAQTKLKRRNSLILFSSFGFLLLMALGYFAYQNQRQKSLLKAQDLEFQVVEKELSALRSQMNPHFLFNSLNSINDYIMHEEPRLASKYLTKFSHLMRTILNNSKEKMISLSDELHANKLYVEMENLRFKEKFVFETDIDTTINADNLLIPSMLIQPYLENAIKHGLRNNSNPGKLSLDIRKLDQRLEIIITDNGVGREEARRLKSSRDKERKSHGMDITADRIALLNQIYDMDASVEIIDKKNPSGTQAILRVTPLRSA